MYTCLECGYIDFKKHQFCKKCGSPTLLLGRYRALSTLGQGGFGVTYLAQDEAKPSKPHCVIKKFTYLGPNKDKAAQLFEQEAVYLERLGKHPQISELQAYTHHDGKQFLVQEFIEGQNLERELEVEGRFDETKIRALLLDVLPVLDFVHKNQVIHRDIKPSNIILRSTDQKVVLIDFGIAKQFPLDLTATGTFIGTMDYSAPEQIRGKAYYASDLYSLGATCLYLLTGVRPSELKDANEEWIWRNFLGEKTISSELGNVLDRMLMPIAQRFGSAMEVYQALDPKIHSPSPKVLHPSSIKSTTASPPKRSSGSHSLISRITGTDYRKLDFALQNQQWQEADELTLALMLQVMAVKDHLREYQAQRFPGEDLKIIDRLWVKHSKGKLGFGVQKRIWHECEMPGADYLSYKEAWLDFGKRVHWQGGSGYDGWRYYREIDMTSPQAYPGHLPCCKFNWGGAICWIERELVCFLSRKEIWIA